MLQIEHLSLTHKKDLTSLLTDVSFSLREGERMALIGEEGNGKSTLLRVLAGDEAVHGYIAVSGRVVNTMRTGYLPQELLAQSREKTAYEFFCDAPAFFDASPRELGELSTRLRLPAELFYAEQKMAAFSGGERVKLQIARLLLDHPQLLLLDEPTNDLDAGTVRWLTDFLLTCGLPCLFVSHDETLLRRAATSVLLIERLRRRQTPRAAVYRTGYEEFVKTRAASFEKQAQLARKEREEYDKKMEKFESIRRSVEHDQDAISRQNPGGGRLLKKKMHAVLSMGRRFERESQEMTAMPECEEAIFARLDCVPLPPSKTVLDLRLDALTVGERTLCKDIRLVVRGREKLCIVGNNGVGKSTLLRLIRDRLASRGDIHPFYMPQDPGDLLRMDKTPIEMLTVTGDKDEQVRIGIALGSMKFTAEEMKHPCRGLSGGQKAKLMFLMMACSEADVLLLDEPTRNLSPLSGPVVRALFHRYPGCIIAVSHDECFAREVCTRTLQLTENGFTEFKGF